jgi:hypothetical protein
VVLVHPPAAPPTVMEALVHLRGELAAEGFASQILELDVGADARAALERAAPDIDAVAVVAVLPVAAAPSAGGGADPNAVEVWVVDRVTRKTVVRRARAEGDRARAAQVLAVRAVELLRASFVELAIASSQPPPAGPPPPAGTATAERWAATAIEEQPRRWSYGVELGGTVLGTFEAARPALLPTVRLERTVGERGLVRLSGAGLGAPIRVSTANGDAVVNQDLLLAEGAMRFRLGRRVQPIVSLGAGALRVSADGRPAPQTPYQAASSSRWAGALDAGGGVRVSVRRWLELAAELHLLAAEPYPVVRFLDTEVLHVGRPSALASLTVVGGL